MIMGRNLKLILATAYYLGAGYLGYTQHYIFMSILLVLAALATYSLVCNGSVAQAIKAIEKQDYDKARKYLNETFNDLTIIINTMLYFVIGCVRSTWFT